MPGYPIEYDPYVAMAAMLAQALAESKKGLECSAPTTGDIYPGLQGGRDSQNPAAIAVDTLRHSKNAAESDGDECLIDHYAAPRIVGIEEFDRVVTRL